MLKSVHRGLHIDRFVALGTLRLIKSSPTALFGSKVSVVSIISDSVIVTFVIFSFVFEVNAGSEASESLTVEIEIKKIV